MERSDLVIGKRVFAEIKQPGQRRSGHRAEVIVLAVEPHKLAKVFEPETFTYRDGSTRTRRFERLRPVLASRGAQGVLVARKISNGPNEQPTWVPWVAPLDTMRTLRQERDVRQLQEDRREVERQAAILREQQNIEATRLMYELDRLTGVRSYRSTTEAQRTLSLRQLQKIVAALRLDQPSVIRAETAMWDDAIDHNGYVTRCREDHAARALVSAAIESIGR